MKSSVPVETGFVRLEAHDLGRMSYAEAYAIQKQRQAEVIASRDDTGGGVMHLLLVEHDPAVITISRRPGARKNLVASDGQLRAAGVEIAETDRGGDITYHGPGQLVVYPILDLNRLNLRLISYLRFLEQVVIDVLARFGIEGSRDESATGVWVSSGQQNAKIAAMGVRVLRWVSMHGLALNVTTNLDHFNLIVPCGLTGRTVTSMKRELGAGCPTMEEVKRAMIEEFHTAITDRVNREPRADTPADPIAPSRQPGS